MGKTRDLFKKIRDTKATFHVKMGTIKDRNGLDLTKTEHVKKRWQEYTELYKKDLHILDRSVTFSSLREVTVCWRHPMGPSSAFPLVTRATCCRMISLWAVWALC